MAVVHTAAKLPAPRDILGQPCYQANSLDASVFVLATFGIEPIKSVKDRKLRFSLFCDDCESLSISGDIPPDLSVTILVYNAGDPENCCGFHNVIGARWRECYLDDLRHCIKLCDRLPGLRDLVEGRLRDFVRMSRRIPRASQGRGLSGLRVH